MDTNEPSLLDAKQQQQQQPYPPIRQKGHYRSSSLENNAFLTTSSPSTAGTPVGLGVGGTPKTNALPNTNFTGTLKSRREQKRITDFLNKQQNNQNDLSSRKAHFENIREIFEKNKLNQGSNIKLIIKNDLNCNKLMGNGTTGGVVGGGGGGGQLGNCGGIGGGGGGNGGSLGQGHDNTSLHNSYMDDENKPPRIQSCSGILGKGKQVIRPIAFKPVMYKSNPSPGGRLTDMSDRYGSTPSLGQQINSHHKFGSTTDLHNGYQYGTLNRKNSSIPFKTYDSFESILKLPDAGTPFSTNSTNPSMAGGMYQSEMLDMTPSPSDSGISELEAALRDRDSELAYLRQTMEHNEHVIFKVHQTKEKHWEQELNRIKVIHENRLRVGAQKVHKLEQMLMMQTFQLRQDKKRLTDEINKLTEDLNLAKEHNERDKNDLCHSKIIEKELNEQNSDLMDEIQMLRRIISDLKGRLEESEWNLCQRNGEIALLKSQHRDAQNDLTHKDQEILQLKCELKSQSFGEIDNIKTEVKEELDIDLEISQLNRIIIFKDQIIVVMNNEIQKLRKELSDLSILNGYEGIPAGRYSRFKKSSPAVTTPAQTISYDGNNKDLSAATNPATVEEIIQNFESSKDCETYKILNFSNNNCSNTTNVDEQLKSNNINNNNNNLIDNDEIIQTFIHNIKNDKYTNTLDVEKKIFLNSQICNISDEDKTNLANLNNNNKNNLPDITLNLITNAQHQQQILTISNNDAMNNSSEDDDFKSLTPIKDIVVAGGGGGVIGGDINDESDNIISNNNGEVMQTTTVELNVNVAEDKDVHLHEIERLQNELEEYKANFEKERMKWADEKEKVLIYQRQLQNNYIDVLNKTNVLEEKLRNIELL